MKELIKEPESELEYVSHEITEDSYCVTVKSVRENIPCLHCGAISHKRHSTYIKKFQDLPIQGKKVVIKLINRKMFCLNPNCTHKTFAERFDFLNDAGTRTKRLDDAIISLAANVSSVTAAKIIRKDVANISKSIICSMLKKEVKIDKTAVTKVCIDDFALTKRQKYATVMIDYETHKVVDMIESRDFEDVVAWLQTYPNLEIVSRDGSITYRKAISAAHPDVIQVSDRFHLICNLTKYCLTYSKKQLKGKIIIKMDDVYHNPLPKAAANRLLTLEAKYELILQYQTLGYNKSTICKELNMDMRSYERITAMTDNERRVLFSNHSLNQIRNTQMLKMERVREVRTLKEVGFRLREISRRTGLAFVTVKKYVDKSFDGSIAKRARQPSILDPYMDLIESLLWQGTYGVEIEKQIRALGYTGSKTPTALPHKMKS